MSRRQADALPPPTPAWRPGRPLAQGSSHGLPATVAALPSTWIDLAKALASQLIVWHHLSLYGPMCDGMEEMVVVPRAAITPVIEV